jgi:hypothetical protein
LSHLSFRRTVPLNNIFFTTGPNSQFSCCTPLSAAPYKCQSRKIYVRTYMLKSSCTFCPRSLSYFTCKPPSVPGHLAILPVNLSLRPQIHQTYIEESHCLGQFILDYLINFHTLKTTRVSRKPTFKIRWEEIARGKFTITSDIPLGFCEQVSLPLRDKTRILCHPRLQPTQGVTVQPHKVISHNKIVTKCFVNKRLWSKI